MLNCALGFHEPVQVGVHRPSKSFAPTIDESFEIVLGPQTLIHWHELVAQGAGVLGFHFWHVSGWLLSGNLEVGLLSQKGAIGDLVDGRAIPYAHLVQE